MLSTITKVSKKPFFYPLVLFLVGLASYGLLLSKSGFYWDDWESVYLSALHNPGVSIHYFSERPLSVLIYLLLFPITKMTPLTWIIVEFGLRWIGILGIYYALCQVWPTRIFQNRWIGILLFVFPAFLSQPIALCYSRHFASFALYGISLSLTFLALKDQKRFWLWMSLSVLSGWGQIFMIEYFIGLEILRPVLIWFFLEQQENLNKKAALKKTFLLWSPFIVGLLVYFWWRFVSLPQSLSGSDPNNPSLLKAFLHSPFQIMVKLLGMSLQDLWYLVCAIWANGFTTEKFAFLHSKIAILAWTLAILASSLTVFYLQISKPTDDQTGKNKVFLQMLLLGFLAFFAGGISVWATARQITIGKWSDRFALAPLVGAAILIVCVIDWLMRTRGQKQALLSFLLAISIAIQIFNVNDFRTDWALQKGFYWQLAWRIPALKPGTAIIGRGTLTDKSSYYDGIYIVNLLFDKQVKTN
ncbi:MAG TPA: hypothetical protein VMC09_09360, partial [Anaerolineales bacterium]|nr:hypothetical protein [Anaerolineales bacterium]